jgi:hypothetical protein
MSNGLPSYGRYLSRPSQADLAAEIASASGFPFSFALVTFADNSLPVLVYNGIVYPFLTPGYARELVDFNGKPVIKAGPDTVTNPDRYILVQNATDTDPVQLRAFESGGGPVDLFVASQGTGLAALGVDSGAVAVVADSTFGVRAVRRTATPPSPPSPAEVLQVDHIAPSALVDGDGASLNLRILPPGDPFGGSPLALASITARVWDPDGTPSSSVDIGLISGNALTLNGAGAVVNGALTTDKIVYDISMVPANRAVGSSEATSTSTSWTVSNNNVQTTSIVSITPRGQLQGASQWWVLIPSAGAFEVHFDAALTANWAFDFEVKDVSS